MSAYAFAVAATAVFFSAHLAFEYRKYIGGSSIPAGISKTLTSLGFVSAGFAASAQNGEGGHFLVGSLLFCVAGDVLLISENPKLFRAGLFSFLIAHIGYCLFFSAIGIEGLNLLVSGPPILVVGGLIYRWLYPHLDKQMKLPVAAYVVVICTMAILSFGACGATGSIYPPIAALVFMASDILVARDRFVAPGFINRLVSLPMYYGAQLLFASMRLLLD